MTDIMEGWRNRRYVTSEYEGRPIVVLVDVTYWSEHYNELVEWCDLTGCDPVGMTVDLPNPAALTAFALRWA